MSEMTKEEAWGILKFFNGWNNGQKSVSLTFGGSRTVEDDIYDERRKLILQAIKTLQHQGGEDE